MACICCSMAWASKENVKKAQMLQTDENYLCGLGHGSTLQQASNNALAALAGQISTCVASNFNYLLTSERKDGKVSDNAHIENIIRTYSRTTLKNALELVVEDEPNATVLRYIRRSDLDKIFEQRKNKVLEYASNAQKYEKEGKVADALSSYYASLMLLRSIPDGSDMMIKTGFTDEELLMPLITRNVNDILDGLSLKVEAIEDDDDLRTVIINVSYKGSPATNFNYTYYNGANRSDVCSAKDGLGDIVIPRNFSLQKLDIHADFLCEDVANYDVELRDVLSTIDPVAFRASRLKIERDKSVKATTANTSTATASIVASHAESTANISQAKSIYLDAMRRIELAIRQRAWSNARDCFTDEGYDMFNRLVHYGNAKILRAPTLEITETDDEVICRSIPMSFSFSGNRRTFVEDVVFHFTKDGKVSEVAFALGKQAVDDIMRRDLWNVADRQMMISFLESYKTAYALKRIDYLRTIFSNDALIITGKVVKSSGSKEIRPGNVKLVKYTRQSKEKYLNNLEKCFSSNEYVNIHFADNIVRRSSSNHDVYGIQIKQDYYSSTYGDTGYLFLLINFKNRHEPLIHVRTWQPDKDPNVRDGRIGIQDFQL